VNSEPWNVICLCAAWCGVCREWHPVFRELAAAHPRVHFAWIDIEDEDEAMGDVEVETFPTLLISHGQRPLFFGALPPSAAQVARLLASLQSQPAPASGAVTPRVEALMRRISPLLAAARVVTP
jgi:thioredoxin 1